MKTLQDGIEKETIRGTYSPEAHTKSNECGLIVANMFESFHGATIDQCVVNPNMIGQKPYYVGDDGKWDIELILPNESSFWNTPISRQKNKVAIEVEVKALKTKYFNKEDIWPSHFNTLDFGYLKYRGHDGNYKPYVVEAAKNNVDILHCIGLYYISEDFKDESPVEYVWMINLRDLVNQEVIEKKNSRFDKEKFYACDTSFERLILFDVSSGEVVEPRTHDIVFKGM